MVLKATIVRDDQLFLVNTKTAEELPVRVVFVGKSDDGRNSVGVEFSESASPLFSRISFPPDDWFTSAERKRPGTRLAPPLLRLPAPNKTFGERRTSLPKTSLLENKLRPQLISSRGLPLANHRGFRRPG